LFYKVFQKIDVDGSGQIDIFELMIYVDVTTTVFTDRVFNIFDEDCSGKIDFREFVLATWNYCTLGNASLSMLFKI
jgi:Ca2+-binding EF-hand superfamily protein